MHNSVLLVGNLTRDAEVSTGPSTTVARLRLATHATWRDADGQRQESTEYHTVVLFGRLAEAVGSWCTRGRLVLVEGRLRTREYDGSDGVHRTTTEIVADTLRLLGSRPANEGGGEEESVAAEVEPAPLALAEEARPAGGRRRRAA